MRPLYTNDNGDLLVDDSFSAAASRGSEMLKAEDYIPMPEGATFAAMPGRAPVVCDRKGDLVKGKGTAVAVLLPQGFTRTLLPATEKTGDPDVLPLLGYTAAAMKKGKVYVAARQTDEHRIWHPRYYNTEDLANRIQKVRKILKDNRVIAQLGRCSLEYGCFTAQNIFYRRWEGGLPVSQSCNARCVGCISEQESECCPSAQGRLCFRPSVREIAEVGVFHLGGKRKDNIISFGQGCEGEPSLEAERIVKAIRIIRANTDRGTINMNTNAGHTDKIKLLTDEGMDSFRVSIFSAIPEHYNAYYRPKNYGLKDVEASIVYAVEHGVYVSLNLLTFPGFTDREEEIEALLALIERTGLQKVQLRNLNIDTDYFYRQCGFTPKRSLGIDALLKVLKESGVAIGNYSRPHHQSE